MQELIREFDHNGNKLFFIDELKPEIQRQAMENVLKRNQILISENIAEMQKEHAERKAFKKNNPRSKIAVNQKGVRYKNTLKSLRDNTARFNMEDDVLIKYIRGNVCVFDEEGNNYALFYKSYFPKDYQDQKK